MHTLSLPRSQPPMSDSIASGFEERIGAWEVGPFLRRAFRPIASGAAGFVIVALVYIMMTPSTYTANAQLMVENRAASNPFDTKNPIENQTDSAWVDSQVEIIKSDRIAATVINELRLVDNSEFAAPNSWLRVLLPSGLGESRIDQTQSRMRYASAKFGDHLGARRIGKSLVIDVSFRSSAPLLAAQIANAVVSAYLSEEVAAKSQSAGRGSKWLAERIGELRRQAYQAQLAAERFKLVGNTESGDDSQVKLLELESIARSYRRMYEEFLRKFAETVQLVSYPEADARIITSATKPLEPSEPRSKLIVLFAALLGGTVGAGWSLARQSMDRTARSPDQIVRETGLDCLGTIAHYNRNSKSHGSLINTVLDAAPAFLVDDLRSIRASINGTRPGAGPQSIGVVSCGSGDGASTTAANLALLYAISGRQTLLVDCCARHPTLSQHLAPGTEVGLVQALENASVLKGVLGTREAQKCAFLPIGKPDLSVTPADRIASKKAAFRFDDLKGDFDMIVLDLPSLDASSDAREIAPHLDGIILVAGYGRTSVDLIRHYGAAVKRSRGNVLGVVLNKFNPPRRRDPAKH
jgi:polysaccharide biosynthesis transport protein